MGLTLAITLTPARGWGRERGFMVPTKYAVVVILLSSQVTHISPLYFTIINFACISSFEIMTYGKPTFSSRCCKGTTDCEIVQRDQPDVTRRCKDLQLCKLRLI